MAAVKISGVLKDGAGKPIQNCTIQLKAKRNSTTVLVNTVASENPDEAGRYSMDVEYGQYSVILLVEGFPPSHAGTITVYEGSRPGTLNDFLGAMTEDDVMPEALRRFEEMVEEAARNAEAASQSAAAAKKSETAAASSKNAAKTSETNAANSAQAAATSQTASENSATAAKKSETNAKNSETAAKTSETNAKSSQTAAKTSETNAKASETAAKNSQDAAAQSESAAAGSASAAASSASASANSQKAAKTSETNAKASETAAANSAKASAASQTAAKASEDAAREYASQAAEPYKQVLQPLPDVWIPFNDSLDMITGFSPSYKKIVIGDDEITMPGDKVVKFKRASTATYINKSGVFSVAKIDEPRFEKEGLLIEGQRTNYFVKSNIPAEWTSTSNIDKTNNGVDEFGFSYAKMRTKDNMTGQSSALSLHTCSASRGIDVSGDNKYCTVSCRVKAPDGLRCRLRFEKYDGSVYTFLGDAYLTFGTLIIEKTGGAANRIAATATKDPVTGWIFYEATIEAVEGETLIGAMIQYAPKKGGVTEAGDYIYLATPQFENGGCASSFVITTTVPATRSSDMVTIPTENNIYNRPLTCLVEVNRNWGDIPPNVAPRIFDFSGVPPIESITYAFNTTEKYYGQLYMQTYKASTSTYVSSVFAGRTDVRKFIGGFNIYSDGTKRVVSNGEATKTMKTEWTGVKTRTFIRIGGQATSGTRHLFGHLRNLRLWHKELTDAQMGESIK
ncbi:prophage tail fiber N-terminal domain-containing protein [Escherichia coli]|nr:prophage tail fiber N-terminal domain-containing protein [Escherichia coli]MBB8594410.1 prophage tail fiber N-terminal domain-containing protein [Escherichia coli]MBS9199869.1 prophage tail fiber N-terminal domain-containing protein [Escherichia coli]HEI4164067.1 prophage tail fiber N-terminal domain-containing protein [Escherichia coli]